MEKEKKKQRPVNARRFVTGAGNAAGRTAQKTGRTGEARAAAWLEMQGMILLKRNYRCRGGEIDIIALEQNETESTVVFVEVKSRTGLQVALPCQAVDRKKRRHLEHAASCFLAVDANGPGRYLSCSCRFDVIEIVQLHRKLYLRHLKQVF